MDEGQVPQHSGFDGEEGHCGSFQVDLGGACRRGAAISRGSP